MGWREFRLRVNSALRTMRARSWMPATVTLEEIQTGQKNKLKLMVKMRGNSLPEP